MNNTWLNRIIFWILAAFPLWLVFVLGGFYGSYWFVTGPLLYIIVYRPIIHIFRLLQLKKIEEKEAWRFFIPLHWMKYFRSVWWG